MIIYTKKLNESKVGRKGLFTAILFLPLLLFFKLNYNYLGLYSYRTFLAGIKQDYFHARGALPYQFHEVFCLLD